MPDRVQSVRCPHCGVEIPLSEALTREIEDRLRTAFDARLAAALENERGRAAAAAERRAREGVEVELRDLKAQVEEKDKLIGDMTQQLAELKRKAGQGSQQMQGEVQEIGLEAVVRACCPGDEIVPVEPGRRGADVLHRVAGAGGRGCGSILWESKRTKHWSQGWI